MTDYPNNISAKLEIIKASEITPIDRAGCQQEHGAD